MENRKERIVIRIGRHHLSFSSIDPMSTEQPITYEPYVVKSGISMAANLREALKGAGLSQMGIRKALVMVDAPVLLIPVEIFEEGKMATMYSQSFPPKEQELMLYNVLPDLKITVAMSPVWRHFHHRSFTGTRNKLYGYLHDQKLDVFAFQQNRFKFCNQFDTNRTQDTTYFLMYVWKQLMLSAEQDELHLAGEGLVDDKNELVTGLRRYLQNVYVVNPSADFNRAPATKLKGMPFDLMALFTKGR